MPPDDALLRLLDFHGRRYWLANGWSLRFRIVQVRPSTERPNGIRYSLTLHDMDDARLLGFDNAHGVAQVVAYDHWHRFRRTSELVRYTYRDADTLLVDFFSAVQSACRQAEVAFEFGAHETELDLEEEGDGSQTDF
jgi:hypothetical protein